MLFRSHFLIDLSNRIKNFKYDRLTLKQEDINILNIINASTYENNFYNCPDKKTTFCPTTDKIEYGNIADKDMNTENPIRKDILKMYNTCLKNVMQFQKLSEDFFVKYFNFFNLRFNIKSIDKRTEDFSQTVNNLEKAIKVRNKRDNLLSRDIEVYACSMVSTKKKTLSNTPTQITIPMLPVSNKQETCNRVINANQDLKNKESSFSFKYIDNERIRFSPSPSQSQPQPQTPPQPQPPSTPIL